MLWPVIYWTSFTLNSMITAPELFVHSLRSEDNASDAASRGHKATQEEVKNCFEHMTAQEEGHRISVPEDYLQKAGVHHEEAEWNETTIDDLLGLEDLRRSLCTM